MKPNHEGLNMEAEIASLIQSQPSKDRLLEILGEEDGALFASPTDKIKRGLRFLRNAIDRVRNQTCDNDFMRAQSEMFLHNARLSRLLQVLTFSAPKVLRLQQS
jgi:hypothetical protein